MPAPVWPASSHQMSVSSPKFSDPCSSPLVTPFPSAQSLQKDSPGNHTALSYSIIPTELQLDKQELHNLVDKTSRWHMEDKDDVKKYTTVFWYWQLVLLPAPHRLWPHVPRRVRRALLARLSPDVHATSPQTSSSKCGTSYRVHHHSPRPTVLKFRQYYCLPPVLPCHLCCRPCPLAWTMLLALQLCPLISADSSPMLSPASDLVALPP